MLTTSCHRVTLSFAVSLVLAVVLSSCASSSLVADSQLAGVKAKVEGVYSLEEWHLAAGVARPPHVDGRFVLLNGAVITLLHNRVQEANQTTVAAYGTYTLDVSRFAYNYADMSVYVQRASSITASHKPPWEGMRGFSVISEGSTVRFRSDTGNQEFLFTADRVSYSENGKVQRVWKRVAENR